MSIGYNTIPKGCHREIRKYQNCAKESGDKAKCFDQKISIMEVCPDHILELLREKKKWLLRAEVIDNETYRRAMAVSDFNRGRSVSELKLKTWEYGMAHNLRSDSLYQDDRWVPTKFSHAHRRDNQNFPAQEYTDFFGGTVGTALKEEYDKNAIDLMSDQSTSMKEYVNSKKKLSDISAEVDKLNKE